MRDGNPGEARIVETDGGRAVSDFIPDSANPQQIVDEHNAAIAKKSSA